MKSRDDTEALAMRIATLIHRLEDKPNDRAILKELETLINSSPTAMQAYLDTVRLITELEFSSALEGGDRSENTEQTSPVALELPRLTKTAMPKRRRLVHLLGWPIAALLAISFTLVLVERPGDLSDDFSRGSDVVSEKSSDRRAQPLGAATVTHPPSTGRVKGGIVEPKGSLPEAVTFNTDVRSILSENCYFCHGPDSKQREGELRLDSFDDATRDRDGYHVIDPGNPAESEMIARILEENDEDKMPPPDSGRVVTDEQRRILERWIEQGARYEKHWSFIKPDRSAAPSIEHADWVRNPIDSFVMAGLEDAAIDPSPEADKRTLLRRLSLDLIGLPPTPEEVAAFVDDDSPDAYPKQVERLLESPHYGERMSLPWLDAARYADSNGFQADGDRHAWPWRDWVVDALNANMPFDQFTIEQIAGDLLPDPTNGQLIATSFNRNHMLNNEGGAIPEEQRVNYVIDRVDTTATTWLGLTLSCAQCHDHKYDPLKQKEYYSFFAYFNNVPEKGRADYRANRISLARPVLELPSEEQTIMRAKIKQSIQAEKDQLKTEEEAIALAQIAWEKVTREKPPEDLNRDLYKRLRNGVAKGTSGTDPSLRKYFLDNAAPEEWQSVQKRINKLNKELLTVQAEIVAVMIMGELEERRPTHVFKRGDYESPGESVSPGVPAILNTMASDAPENRMGLAEWLVSPENPLTARVIVNRYWQLFFGVGLVKTAEDFGIQGEAPSHPQLLDWLAAEFIASAWDVKHMHRLIVNSATYRQSSKTRQDLREIDPENRLLARSARFRLPSMLIRDSALFVSGLLRQDIGGKPVYPYQPAGLWHEFSYEKFSYTPSSGSDLYRRSLYTFWRRTIGPPNMFDNSNRQVCQVKGAITNTPLHALTTLNDPTYVEAARVFADRILDNGGDDDSERLRFAYRQALGREPSEDEARFLKSALKRSRDYYQKHPDDAEALASVGEFPVADPARMEDYAAYANVAQIIFNTDEFLTRE